MKVAPIEKAILFGFPRERRAAIAIALFLLLWAIVAYLVLPSLWRRYESASSLSGRPLISRTAFGVPGDPINMAFVGTRRELACAFRAAGWTEAIKITWRSSARIVESVILHRPDPDAPVSSLYYDGRPEDLAFEKAAGRSADRRHHIRLWRTAARAGETDEIWVAAATFDIGVGLSRYTFEVTHHIDANVDAERSFVADALRGAGATQDEYLAAGAGATLDGRNGGGDRYFTDGEIAVATLTDRCGPSPQQSPTPLPPMIRRWRDAIWQAIRPSK